MASAQPETTPLDIRIKVDEVLERNLSKLPRHRLVITDCI